MPDATTLLARSKSENQIKPRVIRKKSNKNSSDEDDYDEDDDFSDDDDDDVFAHKATKSANFEKTNLKKAKRISFKDGMFIFVFHCPLVLLLQ